ncbi:MAG: RtcB family protein [Thermoleophilia bacterium]
MSLADTLQRIDDVTWELPRSGGMRVSGRILADESIIEALHTDQSLEQVANVAHLPGIVGHSWAMPDVHYGYGFPIGGVAAFRVSDGVVSPGGVGYDINCGVRLLATSLTFADLADRDRRKKVVDQLFRDVPSGVGSSGAIRRLTRKELADLLVAGAGWAVENGFGRPEHLVRAESNGALPGADPEVVSDRAIERGLGQVGTLGSGNHFLELQVVDEIFDPPTAEVYGLHEGQITIMIHCGSRGFGYQVCDDYLAVMAGAAKKYGFELPDPQLVCAPVGSEEGRRYLGAMAAAANYAWANRQIIMDLAERALRHSLSANSADLDVRLVYDVAHNIAKIEEHEIEGRSIALCVHRKGATRAFPPNRPEVPEPYRDTGQPVLIPGDMGTASFVCRGTQTALAKTFGSTAHGAGRVMSRSKALKSARGRHIDRELAEAGILVRSQGKKTLAEEMPEAYKDIERVAEIVDRADVSPRVARLRPIGVVKG